MLNKNDIKKSLRKLISGTDIRGISIETDEFKENLTCNVASLLGYGFLNWLKINKNEKENIKIAIGMDSRISGPKLKKALIETLVDEGIEVYDCGIATTPSMFMTTILDGYKCTGAIMITASHLPYYYNGLKFFTSSGSCEKNDIQEMIELSIREKEKTIERGTVNKVNLLDDYSNILINKVREEVDSDENYNKPLEGINILVDAGNGAGGFFANKVLKELGANIEGSQFLNPDGRFPNHIPNPENDEAMMSIKNSVLNNKADIGIIFDTDVDRAAIVSKNGNEINKNSLIALVAAIVLDKNKGAVIVTDSITSTGVKKFIEDLGGVHHRYKRGYKNVINEAKRINKLGKSCPLAIETSGHAALKENYFLDDGAYLIVKILIEVAKLFKEGKDITLLIKGLEHPLESEEIRIKIENEDYRNYGNRVIDNLKEYVSQIEGWEVEPNNYDGIKINCINEKGWFILRLSLHEPLLVLNLESNSKNGIKQIINKLKNYLNDYDELVV
jgi:phosphomannomutase